MTPYEKGRAAYQQGYTPDENPYYSAEKHDKWYQWNKGYNSEESANPELTSILRKLYDEFILHFYRRGDSVVIEDYSDPRNKVSLSKKDLIELRSFINRWIEELPDDAVSMTSRLKPETSDITV